MAGSSVILPGALTRVISERDRASRTERYRGDIGEWFHYMTGGYLWSKQKEIGNDLLTNKNVAVKAGHGVGKSLFSAALICWWVDLYYPNCFVASTAPSQSQISAIVWREVKRMFTLIEKRYNAGEIDHKLPGKINADSRNVEWKGDNGQLIGFGRKPPENKEDDSFQGIHDEYVLAVGDEAVGLSPELIDALVNITSNENSRRLLICNPTNPASYMGKIFREKNPAWKYHTISVFDSPNFTDEKRTLPQDVLDKLTGPAYVEDKKKEYGENSARYKSRVLGEFAFDIDDALIQPEDIAGALDAEIEPLPSDQNIMGADIASYGEDFTVLYNYHGGRLRYMDSWNKANVMETSDRIHRLAVENGIQQVRIDASGFGGAVADLVVAKAYEDQSTYQVIRMYGQAASPDKKQWFNVRGYWWDKFRLMARHGEIDIDLEDEHSEKLQDELMSVAYKIAPGGGVQIESKEEMRRRGMKSPDFADAAIYASADLTWLEDNPLANIPIGAQLNVNLDGFDDDWTSVFDW